MPKVVSKGNDKYGGHCDGGFSELTGGCVYDPKRNIIDVKNVKDLNHYTDHALLGFLLRRLQKNKKTLQ